MLQLLAIIALCIGSAPCIAGTVGTWNHVDRAYGGFAGRHDFHWRGDTRTSEYQPDPSLGSVNFGADFLILSANFGQSAGSTRPDGLVAGSREIGTNTRAHVSEDNTTATFGDQAETEKGRGFYESFAHFAKVLTTDGEMLAGANAVAGVDSELLPYSFTMSGLVGTGTQFHSSLGEQSFATAEADTTLSATYLFLRDTNFSISALLRRMGDIQLGFKIVDEHKNIVLEFASVDGQDQSSLVCGTFTPGRYTFLLDANSTTSVSGLEKSFDPGGEGEFDISFDTFPTTATGAGEPPAMIHAVPEPRAGNLLLGVIVGAITFARRPSSEGRVICFSR